VFRRFFAPKPLSLSGTPQIRRMKTYCAQSGYVYQYFYEGYRSFGSGGENGTEFVFSISADRKNWSDTSVLVGDEALAMWEQSHARQLSSTEKYAIAKMALFQAFDERLAPEQMKLEVRLRNADVGAIVETLGL
jgi:hypothetical protein